MANTDRPSGLTPVRHQNGSPWNGAVVKYAINASYATALFVGDPVTHSGAADADGIPEIEAAGASGIPIGVIVGFEPNRGDLSKLHSAASTAGYAYVTAGSDIIYEIQENGTIAAASYGLNADMIAGAGDATTGRSAYELDSSSVAVTATLPLRIIQLVQRPDNVIGANSKLEVMINEHRLRLEDGI